MTLIEMGHAIVAAAQFLIGHMGKMPFDDLAIPPQQFTDQRTRRCPEAMTRDLLLGVVAQSAQRAVDRVVARVARRFRPLRHAAEDRPGGPGQRKKVAQDFSGLCRQRHKTRRRPGSRFFHYLGYSNRHVDLLFELISRRYQHKSTVITTNRAFVEWGEVFPNAACVVSLVDRLGPRGRAALGVFRAQRSRMAHPCRPKGERFTARSVSRQRGDFTGYRAGEMLGR